jgi:hypothetical protein
VLTSYTSDLIRLRRDSDDAESDFGYDANGNLNTAAIQSWLDADGASNAYVVTVYDQVNGDDVTQATKADQPLYVASLQNGRPGMRLDGSNHYLQGALTNGGALSQPFNVLSAAKLDAAAVNDNNHRTIFTGDSSSNRMILRQYKTPNPDEWAIYATSYASSGVASDALWNLFTVLWDGSSSQLWKNQSSILTGDPGSSSPGGVTIGAGQDGQSSLFRGDIAIPAIIADPALSAADRSGLESSINDYWEIF